MSNNQEQQAYQSMMNSEPSPRAQVKYANQKSAAERREAYFQDVRRVRDVEPSAEAAAATKSPSPLIVGDNLAPRADRPSAPIEWQHETNPTDAKQPVVAREKPTNRIAEEVYDRTQREARSFRKVARHSDGAGEPEVQRQEAIKQYILTAEQLARVALQQDQSRDDLGLAA